MVCLCLDLAVAFEMSDRGTGPVADTRENDSYLRQLYSESLLTKPTNNMLIQSEDSWRICYFAHGFPVLGFDSFPGVFSAGIHRLAKKIQFWLSIAA